MARTQTGWCAGTSVAALLASLPAGPAWAQASTPTTAPSQDSEAPTAVATDPADTADIVVTAQKRSERLLDVPASVTALSSDTLLARGAVRFEDYQAYIPGLSTTAVAPGYNQINIRGVTTGANQLSATVGTYFDESPTNSSTAAAIGNRLTPDPDLLDIARVEVLRGPQGTLYGANALGGVVKYVFVAPELSEVHGQAQVGVSTVAHGETGYVARAAIGAPIVRDTLGVRVSGFYTRDPGFIDNVATGEKDVDTSTNWGGRAALLWRASDWLTATASALYQKRDTQGFPSETVSSTTLEPGAGEYRQPVLTDEFVRTRYQLYNLTLDADLGFANLVSATSYGRQQVDLAFDYSPNLGTVLGLIGIPGVPFVSLPIDNDVKKFTQELRLSSPTGQTLEYILGGYFTHERSRSFNGGTAFLASGEPAPAPINPLQVVDLRNRYREFAIFANGTLNFNERFSVQAGGRWSRNNQRSTEPLEGLLFGPLAGTVIAKPIGGNRLDVRGVATVQDHAGPQRLCARRQGLPARRREPCSSRRGRHADLQFGLADQLRGGHQGVAARQAAQPLHRGVLDQLEGHPDDRQGRDRVQLPDQRRPRAEPRHRGRSALERRRPQPRRESELRRRRDERSDSGGRRAARRSSALQPSLVGRVDRRL